MPKTYKAVPDGRPRSGLQETKDDYLDCLKAHIGREHNCPAYYLRTETLHEQIDGNTVWTGEVEVFGLIGHPQAKRCFAWGHAADRSDAAGTIVTVLELIPVFSAQNAVQFQLAKDIGPIAQSEGRTLPPGHQPSTT
jgi:hypothetical protein